MPMGTAKAIQEPITGNEELGDLSRPQQALAQFYRAFNSRDLKMINDNFAASEDAADKCSWRLRTQRQIARLGSEL
jgi:hypothetical protein